MRPDPKLDLFDHKLYISSRIQRGGWLQIDKKSGIELLVNV
jgi:hypothetical protein